MMSRRKFLIECGSALGTLALSGCASRDAKAGCPAAVIMQYTGYNRVSEADSVTYACVGDRDGIANWGTMRSRLETLSGWGIPTEFHVYQGLSHGFGLGIGTVAEGWIDDALTFWLSQRAAAS